MMRVLFLTAAMLAAAGPALAQQPVGGAADPMILRDQPIAGGPGVPVPSAVDPRVRTVAFDPDAVVTLTGHYGYQMMIEFGADEQIENVAIGDSLAWQVTPNRRADTLFIKPIEREAATNMVVVTSQRRYAFALLAEEPRAPDDPAIIFRVRFTYQDDAPVEPEAPQPFVPPPAANSAYSVTGSRVLIPERVFDDGERTWFRWQANGPTPGLFALEADGTEALVNYTIVEGWTVVDRTAPGFVLRMGEEVTRVRNEGWQGPQPGPEAPRQAEPPRRGFLDRIFGSGEGNRGN